MALWAEWVKMKNWAFAKKVIWVEKRRRAGERRVFGSAAHCLMKWQQKMSQCGKNRPRSELGV